MASSSQPHPPPFTFVLEYLTSTMVIKTVRPASYSILRLCNIAALVLQKQESPLIHNFQPKAILPWAGQVLDVSTDEKLHKLIELCMMKRQFNLLIAVMFDNQPPFGRTDQHVLTRLLTSIDEHTVGRDKMEHLLDHAVQRPDKEPSKPMGKVVGEKRKYRCKVCKGDGHQQRTCKIVKPNQTVGHLKDGKKLKGSEDNQASTIEASVDRSGHVRA